MRDGKSETTVAWRLMAFDKNTERLVADVPLSSEQLMALRPYLGIVDTDDHFGSYPVSNVVWFAEEFVE